MRSTCFVLLLLVASSARAQGASELDAPQPTTTEETTEEAPPAAGQGQPEPAASAPAPSAPSPFGAPVVPPGYESSTPSAPAAAPYQPGYQPGYAPGSPVYAPPPQPRRTRVRLREGMEIPEHARVIERRLPFLMWPGLGVFAVSYALSTLLVIDADATAAIPFVGPLIWQARYGISADLEITVPLSLLQLVGAVAFAIGVKKRRYLETWRVGDHVVPGPLARRERHFALVPQASRRGGGISLIVR